MGKIEDLEKLQKLKEIGTITEQEFNIEKEKILNGNNTSNKRFNLGKLGLIILLCLIIIAIVFAIISQYSKNIKSSTSYSESSEYINKDIDEVQKISTKLSASGLSFNNMKSDNSDLHLDKNQEAILNYFDDDYFFISNYDDLQRYPKVYKGTQIDVYVVVEKILKSTDDEYEILAYYDKSCGYDANLNSEEKFILRGKQGDTRFIKGDSIHVFGRYIDIETYEIDGISETLPTINVISTVASASSTEHRFDLDTITAVAKYIFGDDIKIRQPVEGEDFSLLDGYIPEDWFYLVTLDNQSNSNFKCFEIYQDYSYIRYNKKYNDLSNNITKNLFVSADFQHFIVTTYDKGTKHVYIDYFDKNYSKLWSREFDYTSNIDDISSPMDYNKDTMAVVIDNDLYLINLKTGENIVDPVLVGNKIRVVMYEESILLVGNDNKDAIMRIGYDGTVLSKNNANTSMSKIDAAYIQLVNNKVIIHIEQYSTTKSTMSKYIVLNENGEIELSTDDIKYLY